MPIELKGWKCSLCGRVHDSIDKAVECEAEHVSKPATIRGCYDYVKRRSPVCFGDPPVYVPKIIQVSFSGDVCDSARYRLDRYGPTPV